MFIVHMMYAMFIALAIAWFFGLALGTRGPWNSFFWFFMVIFLFSWGGGLWVTPFGPTRWGVAWMPFLLVGFFITLLLSAATPRSARRRTLFKRQTYDGTIIKDQRVGITEGELAIDIFFWILMAFLAGAIFSHYVWYPHPSL